MTRGLLFAVCCNLFALCRCVLLFVVWCLMFVVVRGSLFVVRCLMFVVCCWLLVVVRCALFVAGLLATGCSLLVVRSL